jgi:hypothetical protein
MEEAKVRRLLDEAAKLSKLVYRGQGEPKHLAQLIVIEEELGDSIKVPYVSYVTRKYFEELVKYDQDALTLEPVQKFFVIATKLKLLPKKPAVAPKKKPSMKRRTT